jgi:hypothetical protein
VKRITEQPLVRFLGRGLWRLEEPMIYHVGCEDSTDVIDVPDGFVTDFASIPRAFWSLLPPAGEYAPAAIIHDWLCRVQTRTKKEADQIFEEAMQVLGVPWMTRKTMYFAVRWFGRYHKED